MRKISSTRGSTRSIVHVSIEVTYTSAFLRCFAMLLRFCGAWKLLFMSTVHVVFLKYSISKCETARLLPTLFQQFEFLTPTSGKSGRWHARLHFKMSIYFQNTTVCKIEKSILSFTGIHKYANPAVVACTSHPTFLMSRKASHRETRMAWTSFLKVSGPQFWQ